MKTQALSPDALRVPSSHTVSLQLRRPHLLLLLLLPLATNRILRRESIVQPEQSSRESIEPTVPYQTARIITTAFLPSALCLCPLSPVASVGPPTTLSLERRPIVAVPLIFPRSRRHSCIRRLMHSESVEQQTARKIADDVTVRTAKSSTTNRKPAAAQLCSRNRRFSATTKARSESVLL